MRTGDFNRDTNKTKFSSNFHQHICLLLQDYCHSTVHCDKNFVLFVSVLKLTYIYECFPRQMKLFSNLRFILTVLYCYHFSFNSIRILHSSPLFTQAIYVPDNHAVTPVPGTGPVLQPGLHSAWSGPVWLWNCQGMFPFPSRVWYKRLSSHCYMEANRDQGSGVWSICYADQGWIG